MSLTPNLGHFASLAALTAAFPASSVAVGTTATITPGNIVISNGTAWAVQPLHNVVAATFAGGV